MIEVASTFLADPSQWWQIGIILTLLFCATWISRAVVSVDGEKFVADGASTLIAVVKATLRGLAAPIFTATAAFAAGWLLSRYGLPREALHVLSVLALSLAAVRTFELLLKRVWRPGPLLSIFARVVSWLTCVGLALVALGWLDAAVRELDSIIVPLGSSSFSLLAAGRVILTLLGFVILAAYLGVLFEKWVMRVADVSIGIRVGIVKFARFFLVVIAVAVALNTVGVDLTALTVFGGALGVGLGFGLQRIASNFISGFILVMDRSIRQGDVVSVGTRFGVVRELRARYVVVRDRDGVDTLIPNENIITSEVINWSYADRNVRLKLPVQVSYTDNPRQAMELLLEAARAHPRVEKAPPPAARVIAFGENGIDLELRFWIRNPEDGVNNVRSDLYLAIWDTFQSSGITIPFPQRDLRLRGEWPGK